MIAVENPHPFVTTCFIRNTPLTRRLTVSIFILTEDAWWKQFGTSGNCSSFRLRGYRVQEYGATQRFQVRSILHFLVNINQTVRKRETLSIKGGGGREETCIFTNFSIDARIKVRIVGRAGGKEFSSKSGLIHLFSPLLLENSQALASQKSNFPFPARESK